MDNFEGLKDLFESIIETITLTIRKRNGEIHYVIFDYDDYDIIKTRVGKICIGNHGYACGYDKNNNMRQILLHRLILEDRLTQDTEIDHKNNNPLDNRRTNLRLCSSQENKRNRKKFNNCSRFKGVYHHKATGKWQAQYTLNSRTYYIGLYDNDEDAGRAYDNAIRNIFKTFARYNFPLEHEQSAI